jgi:aspartate-semialdehyde dehydrogenase
MNKTPVGILGSTGMVGQRFIALLANHPWFEVRAVAASSRSAGKTYAAAVKNRWLMDTPIPESVKKHHVLSVADDLAKIKAQVSFVFSCIEAEQDDIKKMEEMYAAADLPVVSNNSAHRWTKDVPMIIPEINPAHTDIIPVQQKNRGWHKGLIAVKPNCSIQSYVPALHALTDFKPHEVIVTTLQAISGAGKNFNTWPEMVDNSIPYIGGEEEKSEEEPMKIWGKIKEGNIENAKLPKISATCIRVPASDGHMASVSVKFGKKPTKEEILEAWNHFDNPLKEYNLPAAPVPFIKYFEEDDRPQTRLDRDYAKGMGITLGRLREDPNMDWKFVALSHNTLRGAAGGAILLAELLKAQGYIN